MATIGTRNMTLADLAKRLDPDGKIAKIVEVLNEDHEILEDMTFKECNDGTNHKTTIRTGIPEATWRKLYGGIQSTKSATAQVVDSCGMLEALPKIDVDLIDKSGDPAGALFSENVPHLEGIRQQMEETLFYGDTVDHPERFMGLNARFDKYCRANPDHTKFDYNVLHAGGSSSGNTSIWLVTWGDNTCHGLFPKGSKAGLVQENKGKQMVTAYDASGNPQGDYFAYVTHYKWDIGLTVRDWRSVGRIANIDVSNLGGSSAADLIKHMVELSERVRGNGRKAFYMHPRVRTALRLQMREDSNVNLYWDNVEGRRVMKFDEIPVRASWKISLNETAIAQAS